MASATASTRFPDELPVLERLGRENFDQTVAALERHGVDCDLELNGELNVALEPHEVEWLAEEEAALRDLGHDAVLLDAEAVRAEVHSPLYRGGLWLRSGSGILDPARLAWGLARVARELGVRLHEGSRVTGLRTAGAGLRVTTEAGEVRRRRSRADHRRVPLAGARGAPADRAGLGLRARDRAARPARDASRSGGRTARASATRRTSSTTTG